MNFAQVGNSTVISRKLYFSKCVVEIWEMLNEELCLRYLSIDTIIGSIKESFTSNLFCGTLNDGFLLNLVYGTKIGSYCILRTRTFLGSVQNGSFLGCIFKKI